MPDKKAVGGTIRLWGGPLALALLTCFGLMTALVSGDGLWRVIAWIALSLPLVVILRSLIRSRATRRP